MSIFLEMETGQYSVQTIGIGRESGAATRSLHSDLSEPHFLLCKMEVITGIDSLGFCY